MERCLAQYFLPYSDGLLKYCLVLVVMCVVPIKGEFSYADKVVLLAQGSSGINLTLSVRFGRVAGLFEL